MRKFREKLKDGIDKFQKTINGNAGSGDSVASTSAAPLDQLMSREQEFFRYGKQRGVNLGSWFVLERWIADNPFRAAHPPAQSDLDIARGKNAKQILEEHWDNWITEEDWVYIAQKGINTVRIPIGYYHICGADPSVLENTDFKDFYDVFEGAWGRITKAIESARRHGLGVLIDLHAAPGKQNDDSHAGTSNPAAFFTSRHHRAHTIHVLRTLLVQLQAFTHVHQPPLPNVVGLELINEPHPPSDEILKEWYTSTIKALRAVDPCLPVYLGECWRTAVYADYVAHHSNQGALTVLDHHLYRCFTSSDTHTPASEHVRSLSDPNSPTPQMLKSTSDKLGLAGGGLIVGEWSGALNPGSLRGEPDEQKRWVEAQLGAFEAACAGWFFWTYKKQGSGDRGWGWRDAVEGAVFPRWVGLRGKKMIDREDEERRARMRDEVGGKHWQTHLAEHTAYWSHYPGTYHHPRFSDGFTKGWDDAYAFFASAPPASQTSTPELGFRGAWARRRTQDHGEGYWEFEHGFEQGVDAARGDYVRGYC